MGRSRLRIAAALAMAATLAAGCATVPIPTTSECPTWDGLGAVRVNPAGAPDRHLRLQAAFRVCPPQEGLAEIERKRIELRHEVIRLLSGQTMAQLEDPLRAEKLRQQLLVVVNEKVLKKARAVDVFITGMELE